MAVHHFTAPDMIVARGDHWTAMLVVAPIYLTYRTYQLFVGRLDSWLLEPTERGHDLIDGCVSSRRIVMKEQHPSGTALATAPSRTALCKLMRLLLRSSRPAVMGMAHQPRSYGGSEMEWSCPLN